MHVFKFSETVCPGAELQIALRLSVPALANFVGTDAPPIEHAELSPEDLATFRRYFAAIAAKLPELLAAGSPILLEHEMAELEMQNQTAENRLLELKNR